LGVATGSAQLQATDAAGVASLLQALYINEAFGLRRYNHQFVGIVER